MNLHRRQLPCDKARFLDLLAAYSAAREAHKRTVGVPAPFPDFEILRTIVDQGGALTIEQEQITGATWTAADHSVCAVAFDAETPRPISAKSNPYSWQLLQEWIAAGNAPAAYAPPDPRLAQIDSAITSDTVTGQLKAMSAAEFDAWWAANVTSAAQAIGLLKSLTRVVLRRML